ncbi:MAG TPA: response regulator, partial [Acidobacteriota bacterium]|nr:response regulator [Acidobacteriota bacterium]
MPKPVIVAVDDDPEVLRSVDRDLRQRYGSQYRIMRADSGQAALDLLEKLKARADAVALLLADQRMPGLSGVEYLDQARVIFPDAKRALLTAYADTEAAIQAINRVKIDYYLMKPWDPPDEHLYPVLTDLLDDWSSGYQPPFEGIRLIGHRWSPETHRLKEFLARNQVPFRWLDVESNLDAQSLVLVSRLTNPTFPLVSFPD